MCEFCGIVSALKPESSYWRKMCEYVTGGGKSFHQGECSASCRCDYFEKEIAGRKCFAILMGDIKNYDILRQSMQFKGAVFKTENAAELVLSTYFAFGKSVFKNYHGEFAGVIWDGYEKELILFCDKVGFKRLFYYFDGGRIVFSSDIRGIFKFPFVKKEVTDDIYCKLFTLSGTGFACDTFFNNIYQLQPAYYVSFKYGKIQLKNYFMFDLKSSTDSFSQTVQGFDLLVKDFDAQPEREKEMPKDLMYQRIYEYVEKSCIPSPYVTLTDLTNFGGIENLLCPMNLFTIPKRFKLPVKVCEDDDRELINRFLSDIPEFSYRDEKDINKKEEMYIKTLLVLPQMLAVKRMAHPNIVFPYLEENVLGYSIKSERYREKLLKNCFHNPKNKILKENAKTLKLLFYDTMKNENFMLGIIQKEEILKFTRLFPRPETMLYLIQVDVWLNMFL